ncbi:hypothetical protein BDF22DRAFT_744466 [Syncephalis plumigaleata]|nr:hypothetical protein BDF22DRAFT_744466 [Syncephalis plumigaleata]
MQQHYTRRYTHITRAASTVMVTVTTKAGSTRHLPCGGLCLRKLAASRQQRSNATNYSSRLRARHQPSSVMVLAPSLVPAMAMHHRMDGSLKPKKTVRFSRFERVFEAHSPSDYDRSSIAPRYEALLTWRRISNMTRMNSNAYSVSQPPSNTQALVGSPIVVVDSSVDCALTSTIAHGTDLRMFSEKAHHVYPPHTTALPLNKSASNVWTCDNTSSMPTSTIAAATNISNTIPTTPNTTSAVVNGHVRSVVM